MLASAIALSYWMPLQSRYEYEAADNIDLRERLREGGKLPTEPPAPAGSALSMQASKAIQVEANFIIVLLLPMPDWGL